ncbi:uncharacterized protein ACNLHF_007112 [Anomaloglossus baeobatrachus]
MPPPRWLCYNYRTAMTEVCEFAEFTNSNVSFPKANKSNSGKTTHSMATDTSAKSLAQELLKSKSDENAKGISTPRGDGSPFRSEYNVSKQSLTCYSRASGIYLEQATAADITGSDRTTYLVKLPEQILSVSTDKKNCVFGSKRNIVTEIRTDGNVLFMFGVPKYYLECFQYGLFYGHIKGIAYTVI